MNPKLAIWSGLNYLKIERSITSSVVQCNVKISLPLQIWSIMVQHMREQYLIRVSILVEPKIGTMKLVYAH